MYSAGCMLVSFFVVSLSIVLCFVLSLVLELLLCIVLRFFFEIIFGCRSGYLFGCLFDLFLDVFFGIYVGVVLGLCLLGICCIPVWIYCCVSSPASFWVFFGICFGCRVCVSFCIFLAIF